MSLNQKIVLGIGLVALAAGLLFTFSAQAQPAPGPRRPAAQLCSSVLPRQTAEPILARYRDRLRTAAQAVVKEEMALRSLLIADNSTKAAVDAQFARVTEARNTLARARTDLLWDLRASVPVQDRELAFRCANRLQLRRR